jgi:hypothetical protein
VNNFGNKITIDNLRDRLTNVWLELLDIAPTQTGFALSLPSALPDGWQVAFEIETHLPAGVKLTDRGKTLGLLHAGGQSFEKGHTRECLNRILSDWGLERDGFELINWIEGIPDGETIHCFGEALKEIAHLGLLHDAKIETPDKADARMKALFKDHGIEPVTGGHLDGLTRPRIRVDYLVESTRPKAFKLIHRQGRILDFMEVWGWRWTDIRNKNPAILPAMIYDPYNQDIDDASRAIGEEVCDLFCSYEENDRIHEFLDKVG